MTDKLPITLLTGYLGAGKTTLVNHILTGSHGKRYAVIVNEFADIGIDADLIVKQDEDMVELSSGCVCCTVRHELTPMLLRLARAGVYDAILIETTGLASPRPLIASFLTDPQISSVAHLNNVVTVVDARTLAERVADSPEAREQILFADHILLNKVDLVDVATRENGQRLLRGLNAIARVHPTVGSQADIAMLMAPPANDLDRLGDEQVLCTHAGHDHDACDHDHDRATPPQHDIPSTGISSVSLSTEKPLDEMKLTRWFDRLVVERGGDILRAKAIFNVRDEPRRVVMQMVAGMLDGEVREPWADGDTRQSRLVFIGRGLDPDILQSQLEAVIA
ncbi:MAG: GTP-binding protein [Sphingobium sp.]